MDEKCNLCPRSCGVDREVRTGFCGVNQTVRVARAALHFWEEPCISGEEGSGAVFFSGCNLKCVYCQNVQVANGTVGKEVSTERLAEIFLELQAQNANNINLITATHYVPQVAEALELAKSKGLRIPVVYNCGGYEGLEALRMLEGLVDIYLPDFKYMDEGRAKRYSNAEDYPMFARSALAEMVRQCPILEFDERGMMQRGVMVRHLMLPDGLEDSKAVVKYLYGVYGDRIFMSLMSQYTPMPQAARYPELDRRVEKSEYDALVDYALSLGFKNGFIQEGDSADESFIPEFTNEGV